MGRKKKNRYKLKTSGLILEQSLYADWCKDKTEKQIVEAILINARFLRVLESYRRGTREIELVGIRIHKEVNHETN